MKKTIFVFVACAILMISFIISQRDRISNDIYSLLQIQNSSFLKTINSSLSKDMIFLFPKKANIEDLIKLNEKLLVFDEINYKIDDINEYKKDLNIAKIALFKGQINDNFFELSIASIFSKLSNLSLKDDFFGLSLNTNLMDKESKITLNFKNGYFVTKQDDYIFVRAKLKDKYNSDNLLYITSALKKDNVLSSGGAKFAAYGKKQGEQEALVLGGLSIGLVFLFLYSFFGNFRIFYLIFIAGFGLMSGLSASLFAFKNTHILTIVLSMSLVGLMLDFACSWLGINQNSIIKKESIKKVLKFFLVSFFITIIGYSMFLFADMEFLKQIAIFSIFAMVGSFLSTYYLLPILLNNVTFNNTRLVDKFYLSLQKNIKFLNIIFKFKILKIFALSIIIYSLFLIFNTNFKENVKSYSQLPNELLKEAQLVSRLTGYNEDFKFIKCDIAKQEKLISELLENKIIKEYMSLDRIINSPKKQQQIIDSFKKYENDLKINNLFLSIGFDVKKEFLKIQNMKILSYKELSKLRIFKDMGFLFDNPDLVFIKNVNENKKFYEILDRYGATYFDFVSSISSGFDKIKIDAMLLKLYAFIIIFIIISAVFNYKYAVFIISCSLISIILTLAIFAKFFTIDIFVIFGLILGSAVGVEYFIFAFKNAPKFSRVFGITIAGMTSILSFAMLCFSDTIAIFNFGLCVSINLIFNMVFSYIVIFYNDNKTKFLNLI